EIAAAGNAGGYFADDSAITPQKSPDHVAVTTVPFAPRKSRKRANVVETSSVPGFSDVWHPSERPRKFDVPRQRWIRQGRPVFSTYENAGQIETETINSHLLHPPLKTVNDKARYNGTVAIERIATA